MGNLFTSLKKADVPLCCLFFPIFIVCFLASSSPVQSQNSSKQIIVDQFGWRLKAKKNIIFADPVNGQNDSVSYTPGTQFQVRKKSDNSVVFTGNIVAWNGGSIHTDSGDKIWHGDFSAFTTPGTYYILDVSKNVRSYDFEIKNDVYTPVVQTSVKTFYYQRSGTAIAANHGGKWNHPTAHAQDAHAPLYTTTAQTGTARDVRGGWYDAGDYNKYIPFLAGTLWDLLVAYELRPTVFSDNTAIPESGNGVPDVLDELKWELDWMLKMQQSSGGVNNRVAVTSYENGTDNPATDTQARYYTNVTTWATATFSALTAHAARTYQTVNPSYANTLLAASEKAWTYLEANATMNPESGTDGASLAAADAGANTNSDKRLRIYAAAELFRTTGVSKYKTYFENHYKDISGTSENGFQPFSNGHLDASWCWDLNRAYFVYCQATNTSPEIVAELKSRFLNVMDWFMEPYHNGRNDPYLGFMWNGHYSWGSNQQKMKWAQLAILSAELGVNSAKTELYKEIAEEYLHYIHGRNPLSQVYLSNMGAKGANLGGDNSVMEIYHSWYRDGSAKYDGANSEVGPAPGFLVGGPNQYCSGSSMLPKNEPPMKAYRDWNTAWPDASWEVTEPAIYYQAAYTFVAAYFSETSSTTPPPTVTASSNSPICEGQTLNLLASNAGTGATYEWRGPNNFTSAQQKPTIANAGTTATGSYTVIVTSADGASQTATAPVMVTNPAATTYLIYEDELNSNWADWSWSTVRNYSATAPVQSGTKSLSVKYNAAWAGLYLHANTPVNLTGFTHLKFWIHGGTNTAQQIRVILNGGSAFYAVTTTPNQWKQITVPLSSFSNPTSLTDMYFQEATGNVQPLFYLDKIDLTNSATAREGVSAERSADADVQVFPNPVESNQSEVMLRFVGFGADDAVQATLNDAQGRMIREDAFHLNGAEKRFAIPKLSTGSYFIQVAGEKKRFVKKILVK